MSYDDAEFLRLTVEGLLVDFGLEATRTAEQLERLRARLMTELQNAFIVGMLAGREAATAELRQTADKLRASLQESGGRLEVMLAEEHTKLEATLARRVVAIPPVELTTIPVRMTIHEPPPELEYVDIPARSPEMPRHLQPDEPPTAVCDTCRHSSWAAVEDGTPCDMPQPTVPPTRCQGMLRRKD